MSIVHKRFEFFEPVLMSSEVEMLEKHLKVLETGQVHLEKHMKALEAGQIRVTEFCEKIESTQIMQVNALEKIKLAVVGDPPSGIKGLAQRTEDMEDSMRMLEKLGIINFGERLAHIEEKQRGYDKIIDRSWGASKAIIFVWALLGTGLGTLVTLLMKKFGL